jgi:hypothetical protein
MLLFRYLWSCGLLRRLAVELSEDDHRSPQSTILVRLVRKEVQIHPHGINENPQRLCKFLCVASIKDRLHPRAQLSLLLIEQDVVLESCDFNGEFSSDPFNQQSGGIGGHGLASIFRMVIVRNPDDYWPRPAPYERDPDDYDDEPAPQQSAGDGAQSWRHWRLALALVILRSSRPLLASRIVTSPVKWA